MTTRDSASRAGASDHNAQRGEVVLDVSKSVGPDATRTHIPFSFTLEREYAGLELRFSYEPKVLSDRSRARELIEEGMRVYAESLGASAAADQWHSHASLKNLLTLSLDGPTGFRGCAHRLPGAKPVTLGKDAATPGFIAGVVGAGTWTATVSVHLVVTERCDFRLRVWAARERST